jgi:hypothetical protein
LTAALANQLVLTISQPPDAETMSKLQALWAQITAFSAHLQGLSAAAIQARLLSYEQQLKAIVQADPNARPPGAAAPAPTTTPTPGPTAAPAPGTTPAAGPGAPTPAAPAATPPPATAAPVPPSPAASPSPTSAPSAPAAAPSSAPAPSTTP